MATIRRPHYKQTHRGIPLALSERDLAILKAVYEYRYMDSKQLRALFGDQIARPASKARFKGANARAPHQAVTRRLTELHHHGYLDRPIAQRALQPTTGGKLPTIYALGNLGAKALTEHFGLEVKNIENWHKKNAEAKYPYLLHALSLGNFRTALQLATRENLDVKLTRWEQGNKLRKMFVDIRYPTLGGVKARKARVYPDALCSLHLPTMPEGRQNISFFIEADRSTEAHRYFLSKVLGYREYYKQRKHFEHYNIPEFRVLTICKTKERRDNLRAFISEGLKKSGATSTDYIRFLFATEKDFDLQSPECLFTPIWHPLKDEQPISIIPSKRAS